MIAAQFGKTIYSWEGEDALLWKLFNDFLGVRNGFYVDVGAHHPHALSNTHFLYENGWRGINIDAMPGSMAAFKQFRPEDTNIECGVSKLPGMLRFSMFEEAALNGFLPDSMVEYHVRRGCDLVNQAEVQTESLASILTRVDAPREIDLLSVDVEGLDIEVLESNDFSRWRPKVILAEIIGCSDIVSVMNSPIARFVEGKGYRTFSRLHFSTIFVDAKYVR
jgi:FkbM family methyltransferase